jgi:hypothetical protein
MCPITLKPVAEIQTPVALLPYTHQPYECTPLLTWLRRRRTNPITREAIPWCAWDAASVIGLLQGAGCQEYDIAEASTRIRRSLGACLLFDQTIFIFFWARLASSRVRTCLPLQVLAARAGPSFETVSTYHDRCLFLAFWSHNDDTKS